MVVVVVVVDAFYRRISLLDPFDYYRMQVRMRFNLMKLLAYIQFSDED